MHQVFIDSTVFRQNGLAVALWMGDSYIRRSRVDTTLAPFPAVVLGFYATMESTLIRGSAGAGLYLASWVPVVHSCEIRDSAAEGIVLDSDAIVHNCNLVNNGGPGISSSSTFTANAEDNWWGDAAGPTGPNGDGVSGMVDYTPWRTTPYVLPYVP
jgi:hypothetical protein